MSKRDPRLEPFDALIGTWDTEARHRLVDSVVRGSVTFEWLEGGHFLLQHSHSELGRRQRRRARHVRARPTAARWSVAPGADSRTT